MGVSHWWIGIAYFTWWFLIGGLVLHSFLGKVSHWGIGGRVLPKGDFHWWACTVFVPGQSFSLVGLYSIYSWAQFLIGGCWIGAVAL